MLRPRTVGQALVALAALSPGAASPISDLWQIHIDNGPAPSPQDGPPLAAGAIRDNAYLPLELGAIFGSYVLALIVVSATLLSVGRRLRRSAQTSPRTLAMEMMDPRYGEGLAKTHAGPHDHWDPSPMTPVQPAQEWPSPSSKTMASSVVTFHDGVVEDDRTKNEMELDRLYAAVAEFEDQKVRAPKQPPLPPLPTSPLAQHPPELQHLRYAPPAHQPRPPPDETGSGYPSRTTTTSPHGTDSSRVSLGSFSKKRGVRHLPISPPMGSPGMVPAGMPHHRDDEPLSPRHFGPGRPPTPPHRSPPSGWTPQVPRHEPEPAPRSRSLRSLLSPRKATFDAIGSPTKESFGGAGAGRDGGLEELATRSGHFSPAIRTSRTFFASDAPSSAASSIASPAAAPAPPSPPYGPAITVDSPPVTIGAPPAKARKTPKPAALNLSTQSFGSLNSLPLRSAPLPLRGMATADRHQSTIRATTLERKPESHLRAPGTAVPATPYSPYMPMTPMTPMTPSRLVTKEERKRREKEAGRRVVTVEDAVPEESDLWGDGY
jgi:hypothetical protein